VQLNTDSTLSDQVLPWIDVKPDGTIDVAWYDRRNDPADRLWDVYVTRSTDGGTTFAPEVPINAGSFLTPSTTGSPWPWMGEYLGLAVDGQYGYVAWTSSLNDTAGDVYFDKFANQASAGVPEPSTAILLATAMLALLASCPRYFFSARGSWRK
jgi:hypothetical protein